MDVQLFHNHLLKHLLPFFIELPCICVKNKLDIVVLFLSFLLKIFIYFTLSVLVVACRIFIMSCRIFSCGAQILVVAHRVSCSEACGILVPRPGIEPVSPALEGRFLTTRPPGTSLCWFIFEPTPFSSLDLCESSFSAMLHSFDYFSFSVVLEPGCRSPPTFLNYQNCFDHYN